MEKYNLEQFKGIFIAFNACFNDNDNVSIEKTQELAEFYVNKGVKGLYVCGSSGEGFLMTEEERKQSLEAVMNVVGDKLVIIAHIGAASTAESVRLAQHAESVGAHAIASVPPIVYRVNEDSVINHWNNIVRSVSLPFIIYNMPAFTGFDVTPALVKKMVSNEQIIGIKNTTMNAYQIQQLKLAGGKDFIVFNGPDEQYLAGRVMGADAGIGGTYGVMPELFVKLEECIRANDWITAQKWQFAINDIIADILSLPSLWAGTKKLLKLRGVDAGRPRLPLADARKEDMLFIKQIHDKIIKYVEASKK